jgi:hypothetical protein
MLKKTKEKKNERFISDYTGECTMDSLPASQARIANVGRTGSSTSSARQFSQALQRKL